MADLDISDVTPRVPYSVGASTTGPFTYPFAIFADEDLKVYVDDVLQALTTDYTVSGAGDSEGGSITFLVAIANVTLVILRDIPIKRTTDFPTAGPLNIPALNTELDRHIAIDQQLDARLDRVIRPPDSDGDVDMELPVAADRQDKYLTFGASGEPVMGDGPTVSVTTDTVFNSRTAAAAATISGSIQYFRLTGYAAAGDGGAALYKKISTPSPVRAWHLQSADGAYWQIAEPVLYAKMLGAVGDHATDNAAVNASISQAIASGLWNTVRFSAGTFNFATTWDLSGIINFTIEGEGGLDMNGTGIGTVLLFTGSGTGNGISVIDSKGWTFRDLAICYSSATYSGNVVNVSHTVSGWTKGRFDRVSFYQYGAQTYTAQLIYGRNASDVQCTGCRFSHAANGIIAALNAESSAATGVWTFTGCDFVYLGLAIANPGLNWAFVGCRFEPSATGAAAAIFVGGSNIAEGLSLHGCSFADATAAGTWIDTNAWFGGGVFGCTFGGDGSHTINAIRATQFFGVAFGGNLFSALTNGIIATGASQGSIAGNCFPNTTTPIANITNWSADSVIGGNNMLAAPVWMPRAPSYSVAGAPAAASYAGGLIFVNNESGGSVLAYSDGAAWRRATDRAIIS